MISKTEIRTKRLPTRPKAQIENSQLVVNWHLKINKRNVVAVGREEMGKDMRMRDKR